MKKSIFLTCVFACCVSACTSFRANLGFQLLGVYDDTAKISKLSVDNKEMIFIHMHHLGTRHFYDDVQNKVDSLKNIGYFFYTESVTVNINDTLTIRKAIKLKGVPYSRKNIGYKSFFDSIYKGKVKFKKELMDQPSSTAFGLDISNSKTVDVTMNEVIGYYESKYGEIKLEPCDFEKSFFEKPDCDGKPLLNKKIKEDVLLNFRNKNVLKTFLNDPHPKIAVIYGADHFRGIEEELLKQGFK